MISKAISRMPSSFQTIHWLKSFCGERTYSTLHNYSVEHANNYTGSHTHSTIQYHIIDGECKQKKTHNTQQQHSYETHRKEIKIKHHTHRVNVRRIGIDEKKGNILM